LSTPHTSKLHAFVGKQAAPIRGGFSFWALM
jgi:hypothetical protein